MENFIYGAVATTMFVSLIDVVDKHIPNSVGYYLDLWIPFI